MALAIFFHLPKTTFLPYYSKKLVVIKKNISIIFLKKKKKKKKNNSTIYISIPTISWTEKSFWGNYEPINYDIKFINK